MRAIHGQGNRSTEVRLRMALVREHVKGWTINERRLPGNPDFYFPQQKLAIFVDGCFWHGCPNHGHQPKTHREYWKTKIALNKTRDIQTKQLLVGQGIRTIRLWEHSLKNPGKAARKILAIISVVDKECVPSARSQNNSFI
jgi:DNA mismatch endonuclease Vsr